MAEESATTLAGSAPTKLECGRESVLPAPHDATEPGCVLRLGQHRPDTPASRQTWARKLLSTKLGPVSAHALLWRRCPGPTHICGRRVGCFAARLDVNVSGSHFAISHHVRGCAGLHDITSQRLVMWTLAGASLVGSEVLAEALTRVGGSWR